MSAHPLCEHDIKGLTAPFVLGTRIVYSDGHGLFAHSSTSAQRAKVKKARAALPAPPSAELVRAIVNGTKEQRRLGTMRVSDLRSMVGALSLDRTETCRKCARRPNAKWCSFCHLDRVVPVTAGDPVRIASGVVDARVMLRALYSASNDDVATVYGEADPLAMVRFAAKRWIAVVMPMRWDVNSTKWSAPVQP